MKNFIPSFPVPISKEEKLRAATICPRIFRKLYGVNEKGELGNSFRLIIFDEAFSKMDRGRIKESIRLLRKFGLQAILSAPSDKVSDISELVDETLVVLHDKNTSRVRLYAEEDKITSK